MTVAIRAEHDWHPLTRSGGVTVMRHICTWDGLFAISCKIPNCYDAIPGSSTAWEKRGY